MLRAALRDLQWRRKRFVIAMAGVALVFAMGLVMTGLAASFDREVERTLDGIGAGGWAVAAQASGPFTSFSPVPETAGGPGASPLLAIRQTIADGGTVSDIIVIGVDPAGVGAPDVSDGAALSAAGQAVADGDFEHDLGDQVSIGGVDLEVVGHVDGQRLFAGLPVVYVVLDDAQAMALQGQPFVNAFVYADPPAEVPAGLRLMTNDEVAEDVLRPLTDAKSSISLVKVLLWIVAATIIGSVLYLQAMERTRDFAVFKATGTSTASIGAGLALQAVVLSIAAAALAAIVASLLAPVFPLNVEIPASGYLMLPVVTIVVGLVSSLISLRRTATIEPALAFGG